MTQNAVVTRIIDRRTAEVEVERGTACGGNCPSCESCIFQSEIKTLARNRIQARPGQKVVIATKSKEIFSAAALVYLMPIVLMLLSYAAASALGATEGIRVLVSFLAVLVSAGILILSQRTQKNKDKISFEIVRFDTQLKIYLHKVFIAIMYIL